MNINPLTLIDSLLGDWASPKVRRAVHAGVTLAIALVGVWLAANGDWEQFLLALVAGVYAASNKANTPATDLAEAGDDEPDVDDGLTYSELGGEPFPDSDAYDDQEPLTGL